MLAFRHSEVVQACLVGAVVEAASRHSAERGTAGPALDVLWCALQHPERTRDAVRRLLDFAIPKVGAARGSPRFTV
jgi:hypothetical protein